MKNTEFTGCMVMVIAMALVFITIMGVIMFKSNDDIVVENNEIINWEAVEEIDETATDMIVAYLTANYQSETDMVKIYEKGIY